MTETENHMEQRIDQAKKGRKLEEITSLNLDNCKSTQISGLTEEFTSLKSLSLINAGLTTLKGFPSLPALVKLELSDNRLSGTLNLLSGCTKLQHLDLSGNKIKDLEALEPLKDLSELKNLDLFNCEVTNVEGYREKLFEMLPSLVYLDGFNKENEENEEEDEDDENEDEENGEEGEEDDEDEDDEEEVGLSYLQKSGLEEDSEGEDFEPTEGNEEDEEESEEDEEEEDDMEAELAEENGEEATEKSPAVARGRGVKRKRTAEETEAAAEKTADAAEKKEDA
jgi:hypothetical protein